MPLHKIETITTSRSVYFVEAPDIETAKHEVCAGYANPASDDFLGELVSTAAQVKRKHFDKWLQHEQELGRDSNASYWMGDALIHHVEEPFSTDLACTDDSCPCGL